MIAGAEAAAPAIAAVYSNTRGCAMLLTSCQKYVQYASPENAHAWAYS